MGVALNPWQVIGLFGHGSLLGFSLDSVEIGPGQACWDRKECVAWRRPFYGMMGWALFMEAMAHRKW